eukprot:6188585-Pleurochrysis_carterae.AAC.1
MYSCSPVARSVAHSAESFVARASMRLRSHHFVFTHSGCMVMPSYTLRYDLVAHLLPRTRSLTLFQACPRKHLLRCPPADRVFPLPV